MKKLILPLLFIFLAAVAFGQTKKEIAEIKIDKKDFKQIAVYPASKEAMKHLKGHPALSKYYNFSEKGIKPKPGYAFLIKDKRLDSNSKRPEVLIVCKTGNNGKPNFEAMEIMEWTSNFGRTAHRWTCECKKYVQGVEDNCKFYTDQQGDVHCGSLSGGCACELTKMTLSMPNWFGFAGP